MNSMEGSVTVRMAAPAQRIWDLIADVRNTGKFSPEVMEAESSCSSGRCTPSRVNVRG